MGWERKRGKLEELNRLRERDGHELRRRARPASSRTCATASRSTRHTRLPRDAAKKLIGIIEHPINRPHVDPSCGRVTDGYGILQPRVSVTNERRRVDFARIFAGHTGVDPYTTAVSDTYQDLFGEGSFTGKGSTTSTRHAARRGQCPDNTLLSHDLFEGIGTPAPAS